MACQGLYNVAACLQTQFPKALIYPKFYNHARSVNPGIYLPVNANPVDYVVVLKLKKHFELQHNNLVTSRNRIDPQRSFVFEALYVN